MLLLYPRQIVCEWGARRQLPGILQNISGRARPSYVLVTGSSPRNERIRAEMAELLGPPLAHFTGVTPEPVLANVDSLIECLRREPPAIVLGVGGGSVLDTAKTAAAIAPAAGMTRDYFYGEREIAGAGIPFVALPTTAGTGAEISKNSVLTDPETWFKRSIRSPLMLAAAAVCDAELTVSMPPEISATSGLDALTQAIEAYVTRKANSATSALARQAVELIMPNLPRAYRDGQDRAARQAMTEGSLLTAMSFSQCGLGAVHGLAHPIGARLKLKHGYTCAVLLPHILKYNAPVCEAQLGCLAQAVDLTGAPRFVAAIEKLCAELQIPASFKQDGLDSSHYDFILANCRSNSMKGNPRDMPDEAVLALLESLS